MRLSKPGFFAAFLGATPGTAAQAFAGIVFAVAGTGRSGVGAGSVDLCAALGALRVGRTGDTHFTVPL